MNGASQPILRFAPSPNGYLHLGHAFSALFTERAARELGGRFLLRIEDIDTNRCKPEFTDAIFDHLAWLGLEWETPVMIQSQRLAIYAEAAQRLRDMDLLFPCFCSRAELAVSSGPEGNQFYPGTCRTLTRDEAQSRLNSGEPHAWRIKTDDAMARTGPLSFRELDIETGAVSETQADPARWGDTVIVRKDTPTSYHLSVVVDDATQKVTLVTRGRDLFEATAIHRLLQTLLDLPAPAYSHHRLILDADMSKLAKSAGSASLRDFREAGWTAADVRRHLGFEGPN